jgi:hypothetical protein
LDDVSQVLYSERQRFTQWWFWALVLGIAGLMWYMAFHQLVLGVPLGNHPAPDPLMWALLVTFGIAVPLFMYAMNLKTEVRPDGLYLRIFPLHRRFQVFNWDVIDRFYTTTYRPVLDYGGWGIRYGPGGKAYTFAGNRGIQLELNWGQGLLIGSRDPEALARAITAASGMSPSAPGGQDG